jgi:ribosomal protein S18 acetylase RimI-like enzyme
MNIRRWIKKLKMPREIIKEELYLETEISLPSLYAPHIWRKHSLKYKNKIIGTVEIHTKNDDSNMIYIFDMSVDEKYRGKGIGKIFMKAIVELYTKEYNIEWNSMFYAIGFYEKLGYKIKKGDETWALPRFRIEKS